MKCEPHPTKPGWKSTGESESGRVSLNECTPTGHSVGARDGLAPDDEPTATGRRRVPEDSALKVSEGTLVTGSVGSWLHRV